MAHRQSILERLVEILRTGGPRKPSILRAALKDRAAVDAAFEELRRTKRGRILHRNGGPHWALAKRA